MVILALALTALAAIFFLSLKGALKGYGCAITDVFYQYYIGATALYGIIVFLILMLPLFWVQRFTNSPGNLAWVSLFLLRGIEWKQDYRYTLLGAGGVVLLVSLITLSLNIVAALKGITTCMKSTLKCFWIIDLLLLAAVQIVVAFLFV